MTYQSSMVDASHASVHRWVHALRGIVSRVPRKERTRRFYNNLTSDRLENLQGFMETFMLWYNHLRRHQGLGRTPVSTGLS